MSIIREYYEQVKLPEVLITIKEKSFENNPDIKKEFEYWIEKKEYLTDDCVEIDGYTAKTIADKYPVLDGEGAFGLLVQLREDPDKAHKRIKRGFTVK